MIRMVLLPFRFPFSLRDKIVIIQGTSQYVDARGRVLRRGDNTKITQMCGEGEEGFTILLFLSELQDRNSYGEVIFFLEVRYSSSYCSKFFA